jgi:hypothetical protein
LGNDSPPPTRSHPLPWARGWRLAGAS